MDFTYKLEDIRLIYAFHAFACILVDKKLCTQRCTPKSEGAANFSFYPEVLRCRDHIKLEMNQIVCWAVTHVAGVTRVAGAREGCRFAAAGPNNVRQLLEELPGSSWLYLFTRFPIGGKRREEPRSPAIEE